MLNLHQYKNIFGKPREGNHKSRIPVLDVATVDVVATIIGAVVISYVMNYSILYTLFINFLVSSLPAFWQELFAKVDRLPIKTISIMNIFFIKKDDK